MSAGEYEVRIVGGEARVMEGRKLVAKVELDSAIDALARVRDRANAGDILPRGVRMWIERRDAIAVALEIPPTARTVRWIRDDSEAPFGKKAVYRNVFLAFPYVVLLLVLRRGSPTGMQQLFYRTAPLEPGGGEELLLPNLPNVAEGYGLGCWLCLQHLGDTSELSWAQTLDAIVHHVFNGAFNRSAEEHEGNSWWQRQRDVDPRVASVEAWEEATRASRVFPLEVPWQPAEMTVSAELTRMLDNVVKPASAKPNANDVARWIARSRSMRSRKEES